MTRRDALKGALFGAVATVLGRVPTFSIAPVATSRQAGGTLWNGIPYIVGERGPETLYPLRGSHIIPIQLVVDGRVLAEVVDDHMYRKLQ